METVFLACFLFGALFTVASFVLGFAGDGLHGGDGGHGVDIGHADQSLISHDLPIGLGHHDAGLDQADASHGGAGAQKGLPILNLSTLLVFVTWFGATGYALSLLSAWPLAVIVVAAVVVGAVGAFIIALFLAKVLASQRVMQARDYRLEGTLARVTVSVAENGVGEIVFTKAGSRRSEAARAVDGRALTRGTEVVILGYERGIALVQPWDELVGQKGLADQSVGMKRSRTQDREEV